MMKFPNVIICFLTHFIVIGSLGCSVDSGGKDMKTGTDSNSKNNSKTAENSDNDTDADTTSIDHSDTEPDTDIDANSRQETDSDINTDTGAIIDTNTAEDREPGTDANLDTDTGIDSGEGTEQRLETDTDSGESMDTDTNRVPVESVCSNRLQPVRSKGVSVVIGEGSKESCTEEALHAGVAAINSASGGGTLTFDCGGVHRIDLTGSIYLTEDAVIDGGGDITLSGSNQVRVIELDHHLDFVLQRIKVVDGFVPANSENESGAGLLHPWFGTLKVIDAHFENNHCESENNDVGGGAVYAGGLTEAIISGSTFVNNSGSIGGGILSRSTNLKVFDSVFIENSAATWAESGQYGNGGGLYIDRMWLDDPIDFVICGTLFERNHATVHGSALFSYNLEGNRATIEQCSFKGNDMAGSPGGGTGSVYHEGVPLLLTNSTFSDNTTGSHAGGLFLGGGAAAEVRNCTFHNNRTPGNAGALWAGNGNVTVTNATFSNNDADFGPAIFKGQSGTVTLKNVIMSNNTTANEYSAVACHETFNDGGGNVQWPDIKNNGNSDTPCTDAVLFADPRLAPIGDNGGFTQTMALTDGSPAIDISDDCPETDQRGEPRVGRCDSGAFEYHE